MSLRLSYVDHERYKLRQNRCNDKFRCIDFYFNEVFKIKMNQHEHFRKRLDESSKCLPCGLLKDEWFILSLLLIFFKQFRQNTSDLSIEFDKTLIEIRKF